jgi:hypothetical protein
MNSAMKVWLLPLVLSLALFGCATSVSDAEIEWCLSEDGLIPWVFAASLDSEGGWPQDLPLSPVARQMGRDASGEMPLTESRSISWTDYAAYLGEYERLSWNQAYLEWADDNSELFSEICGLAVENDGESIPPNPKQLRVDAQKLADYDFFLADMRSVTTDTPFEVLRDVELIYAGNKLCYSYSNAKIGIDFGGASVDSTLQTLAEGRVEIVMTAILAAYPPADGEDYGEYVARALGKDWDSQMTEFGAALSYDSAHILCPGLGDFADALASMS